MKFFLFLITITMMTSSAFAGHAAVKEISQKWTTRCIPNGKPGKPESIDYEGSASGKLELNFSTTGMELVEYAYTDFQCQVPNLTSKMVTNLKLTLKIGDTVSAMKQSIIVTENDYTFLNAKIVARKNAESYCNKNDWKLGENFKGPGGDDGCDNPSQPGPAPTLYFSVNSDANRLKFMSCVGEDGSKGDCDRITFHPEE